MVEALSRRVFLILSGLASLDAATRSHRPRPPKVALYSRIYSNTY